MSKNNGGGGWIGFGLFLLAMAALVAYNNRKKEDNESNSERQHR